MEPDVIVRASTASDVAAITEIYRHHVIEGTGSFEFVPPVEKEIARRRDEVVRRGLPWLVAEVEGKVIGYAYAGPFRARDAYRFTIEDSVYVRPESSRQGVGRLLLEKLIALCRDAGYTQMLALIGDSTNVGSIRLHERCGFEHAGVLRDVGIKFDRTLDVVIMQLRL
jgi:L-amino acid N-acyltransferase YncA